jgi:uncharacterized short protein YbdD (DUF466 family)
MIAHADGHTGAEESHAAARAQSWFARATDLVRRVIGVPDYDAYRQHMAKSHPDQPLLTPDEFEKECMAAKYSRPGQRCC